MKNKIINHIKEVLHTYMMVSIFVCFYLSLLCIDAFYSMYCLLIFYLAIIVYAPVITIIFTLFRYMGICGRRLKKKEYVYVLSFLLIHLSKETSSVLILSGLNHYDVMFLVYSILLVSPIAGLLIYLSDKISKFLLK